MKTLLGLIAVLVLNGVASAQTFHEPRTVKINDRVFALLGPIQHANNDNQGSMINSTVIVGDKGVILIDSSGA
jgi:cyclase